MMEETRRVRHPHTVHMEDRRIDSIVYSQNSTAGKKGEPLINRLFR